MKSGQGKGQETIPSQRHSTASSSVWPTQTKPEEEGAKSPNVNGKENLPLVIPPLNIGNKAPRFIDEI